MDRRFPARLSAVLCVTIMLITGAAPAAVAEHEADERVLIAPIEAIDAVSAAIAYSQTYYNGEDGDWPERIVLARQDAFADALAAGGLQSEDTAPLLLTHSDDLPDTVAEEIRRLKVPRVTILGGPGAVSPAVENEVKALGGRVDRIAGSNRIATAAAIAQAISPPEVDQVLVLRAFGEGNQAFADALAAGSWALLFGSPILLTDTATLSRETADFLKTHQVDKVRVIGGRAAVSDAVMAELDTLAGTVDRVSGPDRASTALAVARAYIEDDSATIADGLGVLIVDADDSRAWVDGFAGTLLASLASPVMLVSGDQIPAATAEWLAGKPIPPELPRLVFCGFTVSESACHAAADMVNGAFEDVDDVEDDPEY